MSVYEKLMNIQNELKAPKGQRNSFGNYNYRSCEDILEAVKPLLAKHQAALTISDSIELIGARFYVKATAKLVDVVDGTMIENTAYARESESKKGMDDSQLTGATSSYARKYCLNGLFAIDDTKDADTNEYHEQQKKQEAKSAKPIEKPAQSTKPQEEYEYLSKYVRIHKPTNTLEVAMRDGWKRPINVQLPILKQMVTKAEYKAAEFEIQLAINDLEARQTA